MLPGSARGLGPSHLQRRPCVSAEISASLPGEPGLEEAAAGAPGPHGPPPRSQPVAVGSGAAVTPHSLSSMSEVSSSVPCSCGEGLRPSPHVDRREGRAGHPPLSRDHETVRGPTRPRPPKAGLCTEVCHPCPPPDAPGGTAYTAPQVMWTGHWAVGRENLPLWAPSTEAQGGQLPSTLLSRLPALGPVEVRVIPNHRKL